MPRGTIRASVKVQGTDKATRDLKSVEKTLGQLGGGAKGLGALLGGLAPPAGIAVAALGTITVAAQAYLKTIELVARGFVRLAQRGGEVAAVAGAFERVASPQMLTNLQNATGSLISNFDLMRQSSRALRAELVNETQIEDWFGAITRLAQDAGRDVPASIEQLTNALTGGGLETLGQLGINMAAVRDELRELGLSMESEEGRVKALAIALQQAQARVDGMSNAASNLNDVFTTATVAAGNFADEVGRIVSESPAVVGALDTIIQKMTQYTSAAELIGSTMSNAIAGWVQSLAMATTGIARFFLAIGETSEAVMRAMAALAASPSGAYITSGQATFLRQAEGLNRLNARLRETGNLANRVALDIARAVYGPGAVSTAGVTAGIGAAPEAGGRDTTRPPGPGPSGPTAEERRKLAIEAEIAAREHLREIARGQAAEEFADLQKIEAERIRVHEAEQERAIEAHEREMRRLDEQREKMVALRENEIAAQQASEERTASLIQNFASMAGATQGIFSGITDLMKAMGSGAEETAKAEGAFLIAYNSVMAIVETAAAAAAFASQQYSEGALHTVAAATYTLAALTAAARLGGGSAGAQPAPSGRIARSEPRNVDDDRGGRGGVSIVHNYSLGRTEAGMGEQMERALWSRRQAGVVPGEPLSLEYA